MKDDRRDEGFEDFTDDEDEPIDGYFDDDGNKLNPDLIPKPGLCLLCKNDDNPNQTIECNLNRLDQDGELDFKCGAYVPKPEKKTP
jgi:hypothetical protein